MSRFVRQIRLGTHVQQGDVIGYVGMTGLATGPHLHYEYLVNGVHKDPQTVHLPGAEPLHAEALQKFRQLTAPLLADLSSPQAAPTTVTASAAGAGAGIGAPIAGPLANEAPANSVFSVSSVLDDSRFSLGVDRSRVTVN
jgi:hypothetical protein